MSLAEFEILAKNLPDEVLNGAIAHIRLYCVSMVIVNQDEIEGLTCSGVFCVINGIAGILTARHVWEALSASRKLVLMLGPKQPFRIDRSFLDAKSPFPHVTSEFSNANLPDIALIVLPESIKTSIESRNKAFYSIDRRAKSSEFSLYDELGFWIAVGCPKALMKVEDQAVRSLIYTTDIEKTVEHLGWDYLYVNINLESNVPIPPDLGGMSGGGIWRVRFYMGEDKTIFIKDPSRDILLQGITILQTQLVGRQLVAHGPRSIYERMYEVFNQ